MNENSILHGFKVLSRRDLSELDAAIWEMEHISSGAHLIWIDRAEENKTFGIAFQTQPWNDTGVFHILEHSVLCGSDRYPVKEPFVEMMKSSLRTFLNAMTFPDKTFYPVSSRNEQDLINLMRVYMDAVLHPLIHRKPEIFGQEGWHFEIDEEGNPSCKGVVFNEMKGAFASPDTLLTNEANRRLFPDTCYRFVSGGDPEHIPDLTYEEFTAAHKRLYHPSNSYIFLDGKINIDKILSILNDEFLCEYSSESAPAPIPYQKPVDGGISTIEYELSEQEELSDRFRLNDCYTVCSFDDREKITALMVLSDTICGDNEAPLTKAFLTAGLAKDVYFGVHDGTLQPWISLEIQDIREEDTEKVSDLLYTELCRLSDEGLDHDRILAALDNLEFQMKERDYGSMPQGLVFGIQVLGSWMYGGDPADQLVVGDLVDNLRKKCSEGYFEKLIKESILNNPHRCRILMRPSHTLGTERQEDEAARLHAVQSGWTEEEAEKVRSFQSRIDLWQSTPDSEEALSTIPKLSLSEIPDKPEDFPTKESVCSGLPVLYHHQPTSGIEYITLYFALDDLTPEELTSASFLSQLVGNLDTDSYDLSKLNSEFRSLFGSFTCAITSYPRRGEAGECRIFLCLSFSVLESKLQKGLRFVSDILPTHHWNDPERIHNCLDQLCTSQTEQVAMSGHSYGLIRTLARSFASGAVQEYVGGITSVQWLSSLRKDFDARFPALADELKALSDRIFCLERLTVSVTSDNEEVVPVTAEILSKGLPSGHFVLPEKTLIQPLPRKREGIIIPADISFAVLGGPFKIERPGISRVTERVVSLAYLWNAVRVQGGAYGTGMLPHDTGFACFYSYRDPNAARSLDCYRQVPSFLRRIGDMDLSGIIIGTVAESEPLRTPRTRGKAADSQYWSRISYEDRCRDRKDLLSASAEDVIGMADAVEDLIQNASICVIGSKAHLEACSESLDEIITL